MEIFKFTEDTHMDPETESHQTFVRSIRLAWPIHGHDFYEFFLITRGRTLHYVNGERQELSEGALVLIRPEDEHYYDYDDDGDCQFINIPYTKKAIGEAFDFLGSSFRPARLLTPVIPPVAMLSPIEKGDLLDRFERLYTHPFIDKAHIRIILRGLLVEMLTRYFPNLKSYTEKSIPLWLENLLVQMHRKENFIAGLARMQALCERSSGHLNKAMKQYFNTTPTHYINRLRLNYAKNLLLTTQLSVTDVALETGFGNLSHFYHVFADHFHMTPQELRKR